MGPGFSFIPVVSIFSLVAAPCCIANETVVNELIQQPSPIAVSNEVEKVDAASAPIPSPISWAAYSWHFFPLGAKPFPVETLSLKSLVPALALAGNPFRAATRLSQRTEGASRLASFSFLSLGLFQEGGKEIGTRSFQAMPFGLDPLRVATSFAQRPEEITGSLAHVSFLSLGLFGEGRKGIETRSFQAMPFGIDPLRVATRFAQRGEGITGNLAHISFLSLGLFREGGKEGGTFRAMPFGLDPLRVAMFAQGPERIAGRLAHFPFLSLGVSGGRGKGIGTFAMPVARPFASDSLRIAAGLSQRLRETASAAPLSFLAAGLFEQGEGGGKARWVFAMPFVSDSLRIAAGLSQRLRETASAAPLSFLASGLFKEGTQRIGPASFGNWFLAMDRQARIGERRVPAGRIFWMSPLALEAIAKSWAENRKSLQGSFFTKVLYFFPAHLQARFQEVHFAADHRAAGAALPENKQPIPFWSFPLANDASKGESFNLEHLKIKKTDAPSPSWPEYLRLRSYLLAQGTFRFDRITNTLGILFPNNYEMVNDRLTAKNLQIYEAGFKALFAFDRHWYMRGFYSYGWIVDGDYSELFLEGDQKGNVQDALGGFGYLGQINRHCALGVLGGWAFNEQITRLHDANDPAFDGLKFTSIWNGPWLGLDFFAQWGGVFLLNLGYEFHLANWRGSWILEDGEVSTAFSDQRKGGLSFGQVVYGDLNWTLSHFWIGVEFKFQDFTTQSTGTLNASDSVPFDSAPISGPVSGVTSVKEATWESFGASLNMGYIF